MDAYTVLVCPSCGAKTSLRQSTATATCDYCGNELILRPGMGGPALFSGVNRDRPMSPMPEQMSLKETPDGFVITRRWFNASFIFLAVFSLFWDGFLVFFYSMLISGGAPLPFALFPLIHVAVGVGITYYTLAGFLNSSFIELSKGTLLIDHSPLPWPGNRRIPVADLEQLYTKEVSRRTKNGSSTSYTVSAVIKGGKKIDLLTGMPDPETGLFVEQQIEIALRIPDLPVAGEMWKA
jgi:DNA-directed RNA polymerase subunit RPC12/RpoP